MMTKTTELDCLLLGDIFVIVGDADKNLLYVLIDDGVIDDDGFMSAISFDYALHRIDPATLVTRIGKGTITSTYGH